MSDNAKKTFHKRKKLNFKVKQDLQTWLLVRIMGVCLVAILIASILLYLYSVNIVDADYLSFAPRVRKVSEVLLPILIAASLTSIVAGLLLALFLPQKIAGPIFRIEQDLLQIREGDLTKTINLRCADILKELAESVNMTMHDIRILVKDAQASCSELETKIIAGDLTEVRKALENHKKHLERIKTTS